MNTQQRHPSAPTGRWRAIGIIAMGTVLMGLWLRPGDAQPIRWDSGPTVAAETRDAAVAAPVAPRAMATPEPDPGPRRVSVLDLAGKLCVALLIAYGIAYALSRYGFWKAPGARPARRWRQADDARVAVRETCALPGREGSVYLVEFDGRTLLLGANATRLEVLWAPGEATRSFAPVTDPEPEVAPVEAAPEPPAVSALPARGTVRGEADWARERSQLISALMHAE